MTSKPFHNTSSTEKFKFVEKSLLNDKNLSKTQRMIMVFLSMIQLQGVIPIVSLARRWNMSKTKTQLTSQVKKHLHDLEEKGYISMVFNGKAHTAIKLAEKYANPTQGVYINAKIPADLTLNVAELYMVYVYQAYSTLKFPSYQEISKKIGIPRETISEYCQKLITKGYFTQTVEIRNGFKVKITRLAPKYVMKLRQPSKNKAVNNKNEFVAQLIKFINLNKTLKYVLRKKSFEEKKKYYKDLFQAPKKAWQYKHLEREYLDNLKIRFKNSWSKRNYSSFCSKVERTFDYVINTFSHQIKDKEFKNDQHFLNFCACIAKNYLRKMNYQNRIRNAQRLDDMSNEERRAKNHISSAFSIGNILKGIINVQ